MRVTAVAEEMEVTPKIAVDWYNFCRDVCEEHFLANPILIGGPGTIVEIDESKFGLSTQHRRTFHPAIQGRSQDL